jgi:uncharacterized protein
MLAVHVQSPVSPQGEETSACKLAETVGFPFEIVEHDDLAYADFSRNDKNRCYFCKAIRMGRLVEMAKERGFAQVVEGSNASDGGDYRPGMRAVSELNVKSPLAEAGLQKDEIRQLANALGLPVWDRPSMPCLATRFPYGTGVTYEGLKKIGAAEQFLMEKNFNLVRVRYQPDGVRIEVAPDEIGRLVSIRAEINSFIKGLGFNYVSVDLQGYRQGSLNEVLK